MIGDRTLINTDGKEDFYAKTLNRRQQSKRSHFYHEIHGIHENRCGRLDAGCGSGGYDSPHQKRGTRSFHRKG
jgi:hypothetical protein